MLQLKVITIVSLVVCICSHAYLADENAPLSPQSFMAKGAYGSKGFPVSETNEWNVQASDEHNRIQAQLADGKKNLKDEGAPSPRRIKRGLWFQSSSSRSSSSSWSRRRSPSWSRSYSSRRRSIFSLRRRRSTLLTGSYLSRRRSISSRRRRSLGKKSGYKGPKSPYIDFTGEWKEKHRHPKVEGSAKVRVEGSTGKHGVEGKVTLPSGKVSGHGFAAEGDLSVKAGITKKDKHFKAGIEGPSANVHLGPVSFGIGVGAGVEVSGNIKKGVGAKVTTHVGTYGAKVGCITEVCVGACVSGKIC